FWGDSHMLALAPAIDHVLKLENRSATLQVTSTCPPIFGVMNDEDPRCRASNEDVRKHLADVDAVIMFSFWSSYFTGRKKHVHLHGDPMAVIKDGLAPTVEFLIDAGIDVY